MTVRHTIASDLSGLKEVADSSGLFPSEYLDEMIFDYLNNPESEETWISCLLEDNTVGFGYCVPEKFTEGTYNLLAIAVRRELQGQGIGKAMMRYIEQLVSDRSGRILIVETSSDPQYSLTRDFYDKLGYRLEATVPDFWKEGEDKLIYWKKLT